MFLAVGVHDINPHLGLTLFRRCAFDEIIICGGGEGNTSREERDGKKSSAGRAEEMHYSFSSFVASEKRGFRKRTGKYKTSMDSMIDEIVMKST